MEIILFDVFSCFTKVNEMLKFEEDDGVLIYWSIVAPSVIKVEISEIYGGLKLFIRFVLTWLSFHNLQPWCTLYFTWRLSVSLKRLSFKSSLFLPRYVGNSYSSEINYIVQDLYSC